jgi:hypothetical protein
LAHPFGGRGIQTWNRECFSTRAGTEDTQARQIQVLIDWTSSKLNVLQSNEGLDDLFAPKNAFTQSYVMVSKSVTTTPAGYVSQHWKHRQNR